MPSIRRTTNPLQYTKIAGVIISEQAVTPGIVGRGINNAILFAQFERGPAETPFYATSLSEIQELFGDNQAFGGNKALSYKRWDDFHVVRVAAAAANEASWTQVESTENTITITAKYKGAYGNNIQVTIADGSTTGTKKFTFTDTGIDQSEVFDDVITLNKSDAELATIFGGSRLVDVTDAHATEDVANVANQNLATGANGSVAAADYERAINATNLNVPNKLYFADDQSAGVKAALRDHVTTNRDGQCVLGPENLTTTVDQAITDAATYLDQEGRVLYVYNPLKFITSAGEVEQSPVFMLASVINLTPPHLDPSAAETSRFTQGAFDTKFNLSLADQIKLKDAGIMVFENDRDIGIQIVQGVTGNPEWSVQRRRFSDFYLNSIAFFLKKFKGGPITKIRNQQIDSAIRAFDQDLIVNGILPAEGEFRNSKSFNLQVGVQSDRETGIGILKIDIQRRMFGTARFIVLKATVSDTVEITEV